MTTLHEIARETEQMTSADLERVLREFLNPGALPAKSETGDDAHSPSPVSQLLTNGGGV